MAVVEAGLSETSNMESFAAIAFNYKLQGSPFYMFVGFLASSLCGEVYKLKFRSGDFKVL